MFKYNQLQCLKLAKSLIRIADNCKFILAAETESRCKCVTLPSHEKICDPVGCQHSGEQIQGM